MPWTAVNSPPLLTTRTWSVPSTKTIFISPSATSSTPRRSIRLIGPASLRQRIRRRQRGGGRGGRARVPLRLEQLAQPVAGGLERDPRDDRLEEAEDDELAGLVGRDAAALEIEELGLVDRPDRRRVRRPAAVRLVDLERRDRDRAGLLREVHPELAEEAVGADGGLLDRDQALHVATASHRAGRPSRGGCRSCRGRCGGCTRSGRTAAPRRRTRSRPARRSCGRRRGGCRPGSGRAAPPSWASAQWSVAPSPIAAWRCWNATVFAGRSWMLATRERRAGGRGRPRACREQRLRPPRSAAPAEPESSSTSDAAAPAPRSTIVRVSSARPPARRPASAGRRGASRLDAGAARGARRPGSRRRGSAGRACRRRAAARRSSRRRRASVASGCSPRTCRGSRRGAARRPRATPGRSSRSSERVDARRAGGGRRSDAVRRATTDLVEVGRPQVDVRRVELVRLDRQVVERREGRAPVGRQPVGLARRRAPRRAPRSA